MKRKILMLALAMLAVCLCAGLVVGAGNTADPSDSYVPLKAPYEAENLDLWFEHSFDKVMTSDTTPSGMETYSVYMAKNEIENAQFVLYSDEEMTPLSATVSDFTDGKGNTIPAEIYYQMYITVSGIETDAFLGGFGGGGETFVREGETPDAVMPLSAESVRTVKHEDGTREKIMGEFTLNAGKSQAFYIKLKSTAETASGWYSAKLDIKDENGNIIKTAMVYAYVWDFVMEEETALRTAFNMFNVPQSATGTDYNYKMIYDYLLENRILGMDVPGTLNAENEYLTNPRVSAIRVNAGGGANVGTYKDDISLYSAYKDIYTELSAMSAWEDIKDKFYFYTCDEIMSQEMHDSQVAANARACETLDDAILASERLKKFWPDAQTVVPVHENTPYPYYSYGTSPISSFDTSEIMDNIQGSIDFDCVTIYCPQSRAFTPNELLKSLGYDGNHNRVGARTIHGTVSGNILAGESWFNWDDVYGMTRDRMISAMLVNNQKDDEKEYQFWAYIASCSGSYSYANFLIENTGLQTKMQWWQLFQEDATGYLYYDVNSWQTKTYIDKTVTGAKARAFTPARSGDEGAYTYGMGSLFYKSSMARTSEVPFIGTIRVDIMRDGIEDYQMMTMLEELAGSVAADVYVDSVCDNIVDYLGLPNYDRSAHPADLTDSDIMALTRIDLGNAVEAATAKACTHSWDGGKVTKAATCLEMGITTYTCEDCGAKQEEYIPTIHATGESFKLTGGDGATCTEDGRLYYTCDICGYTKFKIEKAFHNDPEALKYTAIDDGLHKFECTKCGVYSDIVAHEFITDYTMTCTEAGKQLNVCRFCDHSVEVADKEALGHYYVDGVCATCGENDPDAPVEPEEPEYVTGDLSGEGAVNISDLFALKGYLAGTTELSETAILAADCNGDGKVNISDFFSLKKYLASGEF